MSGRCVSVKGEAYPSLMFYKKKMKHIKLSRSILMPNQSIAIGVIDVI